MPDLNEPADVTEILRSWISGDRDAEERLFPLVYDELKSLARSYLRKERGEHTLQPTALVNEAYLRLIDQTRVDWKNRSHFYGIAAQIMRRILIDHARSHTSGKRGGAAQKISLDDATISVDQDATDLLALDQALTKLAAIDPRKERVVELMYFAGLEQKEVAVVLDVAEKTVQRDWQMAKLWLLRELSAGRKLP